MSSILSDLEDTLSNKELGKYLLKKYEKYLASILGVHIRMDNGIPYYEIDNCLEGVCIKDGYHFCGEDNEYLIPDWMEFKAKPNRRRDKEGYISYCKLYTGNSKKIIKFYRWKDNSYPYTKQFTNVMMVVKDEISPNYYKQMLARLSDKFLYDTSKKINK